MLVSHESVFVLYVGSSHCSWLRGMSSRMLLPASGADVYGS